MNDEHDASREEPMFDAGVADDRAVVEPVAVGPGDPSDDINRSADDGGSGAPSPVGVLSGADGSLLSLVDRLTAILERTDLGELEVGAGGTTIVLRAPSAVERPVTGAASPSVDVAPGSGQGQAPGATAASTPPAPAAAARPSVKAPLTGIYYGAPSPGATPYVAIGDHVAVGQIIGLIEAMKLFNEIKSDLAGRVVRICADNGMLVKAKQPLIEVEPV
jgi:acetyl-CoA carboxylase biotin carboxyl carrier protein